MKQHWTIRYTIPIESKNTPGNVWHENHMTGVVADTIDDAMARVRTEFPTCTIYSVHHAGKIAYVL